MPNVNIMNPLYLAIGIIIAMILLAAWKYKKLKHPATYLAITVNIVNFFLEPLGRSEMVQEFLKTVVKG